MRLSWKKLLIIGAASWIGGGLMVGILFLLVSKDLPSLEQLEQYAPRLVTRLISSDGVVIKEFYTQRRVYVPLERMPVYLEQAVLSTEDRRFYRHWGVDVIRLMKAIMVDISTFSKKQGASTITQQLARNLYFTHKQTMSRKLKEFITAIQIERHYSKQEILEMYLTQTYFGGGAYGIQAAGQRYFSKDVEELTLDECALLIAVLKAPTRYSPIHNPINALRRRNLVLYNMYRWGHINRRDYLTARAKPLDLNTSEETESVGIAPYFTEYIRQQLEEKEDTYGFDYYHDGLTIYTTINAQLQGIAEEAVASYLPYLDQRFLESFAEKQLMPFLAAQFPEMTPDSLDSLSQDSVLVDSLLKDKLAVQVAFVALEPGTGKILAMIGGRDFMEYKFIRAVQSIRQPGSAFKPFAYLAAIDNGYPPTYRLLNQDVVIEDADGKRWTPHNYDYSRGSLTTLRDGLRLSHNLVAVRLVQEVVPPRMVVDYARKMGITSRLAAVDAIALGASSVTPIELTAAYGGFAAGGVFAKPYGIVRIEDKNGNIIEENAPAREVVISEQTAYMMTNLLQTVVDAGTGGSARWKYHFYRPAAGKTGTTNGYTDAWFIGFTPQICAGVWVGLDDPFMSLGKGQSGSRAALPIWARFMKAAHDSLGLEVEDFIRPEGIIEMNVCSETYDIASKYCPNPIMELFIEKYAPTDSCKLHRGKSW